ncbi:hypothetical protein FGADI_10098 [Fusarium gaditjirri]|uniref:Uncharacterized protein n=1 Tax=Fusarium gaditjirri TaxID=282569 RepID=A0A8H4SYB0_9HYPO|nr:hypothetical protein FGADI_10098 [Fusarium gaditjirri]
MTENKEAKLSRKWTQDIEWKPGSRAVESITEQGLTDPKPFLGSTTASGDATFYFTSGNKIYMFDAFDSDVYSIKNPSTAGDLIDLVARGKQKEIEFERFQGQ